MRKTLLLWIGVFYIAFSGGGGCNVFSDVANKTSDAAIEDDVTNLIDAQKWNDAILKWGTLSPAGQALRANQVLLATAWSGLGGLNILNLANNLSGSSEPTFFLTLMVAFKGATVSGFNDEVQAESIMLNISNAAAGRTVDENTFMIFLEMAKLGTLFAATADTNADGVVDAAFDSCHGITTLQAEHVATAIGILVDSMNSVGNSIANGATATLQNVCTTVLPAGSCSVFLVGNVSGVLRQVAQTLVGENNADIGLQVASTKNACEVQGGAPPCFTDAFLTLCP